MHFDTYARNREREKERERWEFVPICLKALCTCQWVGCHTYVRPERAVNTFLRVHHDLFHPIASITQTLRRAGYRCTTATITAATSTTISPPPSTPSPSSLHPPLPFSSPVTPRCNRPFVRATSVNSSAPL